MSPHRIFCRREKFLAMCIEAPAARTAVSRAAKVTPGGQQLTKFIVRYPDQIARGVTVFPRPVCLSLTE